MNNPPDAFMRVVEKIVSTRTDGYYRCNDLVHLSGRGPDGKTECGLPMNLDTVYYLRPDNPMVVTCEKCLALAPPLATKQHILRVHAEFGRLNKRAVRVVLGCEWPAAWEAMAPGEFIFEPDLDPDQLPELKDALETLHDFREFWFDNVTQTKMMPDGNNNLMWRRVAKILEKYHMNGGPGDGEAYFKFDPAYRQGNGGAG